jgi:hypothetical protein
MSNPVQPNVQQPRAARNRNPGDLRPRSHAPAWPGQSDVDGGPPDPPYAIFATNADGWAALGLWLLYAHYIEGKTTTTAKIEVFAPAGDDNDTSAYAAGVAAKVGEDANPADPAVRKALCIAISKWESSTAWPEAEIDSGMLLCESRWPAFQAAIRGVSLMPSDATMGPDPARSDPPPDAETADDLNADVLDGKPISGAQG